MTWNRPWNNSRRSRRGWDGRRLRILEGIATLSALLLVPAESRGHENQPIGHRDDRGRPLQASAAATVARSALRAKADAAQGFGPSAVETDAGLDVVNASINAEAFSPCPGSTVEASASVARAPAPPNAGTCALRSPRARYRSRGTFTRTRLRCPCPCNPSSAPSRRGSKLNTGVCTRR
jgi:hypothetical protein